MRNIFDSYSKNEDRLTHALFSTLDSDKDLLKSFIRNICKVRSVPKNLSISVQNYPFESAYTEKKIRTPSRPDAWIYNKDGFALVFEAKITDNLKQGQLTKHQKTAQKQGFKNRKFYTITALPNVKDFDSWTEITWVSIYKWLKKQAHDNIWAKNLAEYFEILEEKMCEELQLNNANITAFSGFPSYEDGYKYIVAKSAIRQATRELRNEPRLIRQLGVNTNARGRKAIKEDKGNSVWDYVLIGQIPENKDFTNYVHLTLGISETDVEAVVTIPHHVNDYQKKKIKRLGEEEFIRLCRRMLEDIAADRVLAQEPNAQPILRGQQRRYPSRGSKAPYMDSLIKADIRTAFTGYDPKHHEQSLKAAYDVFCKRTKKTNYEFQIGMSFSYKNCPNITGERALDLITRAWLVCKPLIDLCQLENAD